MKLIKRLLAQIKAWFLKTFVPWIKEETNWMQIVNLVILFVAYGKTDLMPGLQAIIGLWIFILLVYYIFWKMFGLEKYC